MLIYFSLYNLERKQTPLVQVQILLQMYAKNRDG